MKKLGILVSGRGSNMQAILEACDSGSLKAKVGLVLSNNADCPALIIAQKYNIATLHLSSKTHPDQQTLDLAMHNALSEHQIEIVIMAGFMKKIGLQTLSAFKGRIINIHPSLLPKFGGKGMYGHRVHEAVIAAGEKESGVTIHLVEGDYDQGQILAQRKIALSDLETSSSLADKILKIEHVLYAETIQKIIDGQITRTLD